MKRFVKESLCFILVFYMVLPYNNAYGFLFSEEYTKENLLGRFEQTSLK